MDSGCSLLTVFSIIIWFLVLVPCGRLSWFLRAFDWLHDVYGDQAWKFRLKISYQVQPHPVCTMYPVCTLISHYYLLTYFVNILVHDAFRYDTLTSTCFRFI